MTNIQMFLQELYRKKPGMAMEEARKPENLPRNRYRDILPCKNTTMINPWCHKIKISNLLTYYHT